jgi:cell division septum initiation protein DivIVA
MTKYYGNKKIDNLTDAIKALRKSPLFSEITEEVDMFMDALQSKSEQLEQEKEDLKDALEDAQNGLRHYEDGKPDKADDELHERIDKLLNPKEED